MQAHPISAYANPSLPAAFPQSGQAAECVYRSLTLVAMLLVLASLWVF